MAQFTYNPNQPGSVPVPLDESGTPSPQQQFSEEAKTKTAQGMGETAWENYKPVVKAAAEVGLPLLGGAVAGKLIPEGAATVANIPQWLLHHGAQGAAMGAGTLVGQQIEEGAHVPTSEELTQAGKDTALGAGMSVYLPSVVNPVLGEAKRALTYVARQVIVPAEILKGGSEALTEGGRALYQWLKQLGTSPMPRQVLDTDPINTITGFVTNSITGGRGLLKQRIQQNTDLLTKAGKSWIETEANMGFLPSELTQGPNQILQQVSKERIGQNVANVLQGKTNLSQMADVVNYRAAGFAADESGAMVDYKKTADYVRDEAGKNPYLTQVWQDKRIQSYLPQAEEANPAAKFVSDYDQRMGEGSFAAMNPKAQARLLRDNGFSLDQMQEAPTTIPASNAMQLIHELNTFADKDPKLVQAAAKIGNRLGDDVNKGLYRASPEARDLWQTAQTVHSDFASVLDDRLKKTVIDKIIDTPAVAVQTVMGGSEAVRWPRLKAIRDAMNLTEAGTVSAERSPEYIQNVVEPIRYHTMLDAQDPNGVLNGAKYYSNLDKMGLDMGTEVYGSAKNYNRQMDFALALKTQQETAAEMMRTPGMLMRSMQTLVLVGGGSYWATRSDNPVVGAVKGTAVVLLPLMAARSMIANPEFTKMLIEGVTQGVSSTAWTRALATATTLGIKNAAQEEKLTPGQRQFYYDPSASSIAPEYVDKGVEPSFQFIPSDTATRQAARVNNAVSTAPQGATPQ